MPDYWKIDKELVKRLAGNSRLDLSEEEIEKIATDLLSRKHNKNFAG